MLDWLKTILGETYTADIDKKVSAEIGKGFVAKADFNAVNEVKKTLETAVTDRDKQIDDLKKIDPSALQAEITRLQCENIKTPCSGVFDLCFCFSDKEQKPQANALVKAQGGFVRSSPRFL